MPNQYEKLVKQQARLKQKIERENFKLRQSKYYENRQARKARSRRLIQKGALLEKYFQADNLSVEQTEELLKIFANYINAHKPNKFKTTSLVTRPIVFIFWIIFRLYFWVLICKIL